MKIVFTSEGPNLDAQIDPRFGRAAFLVGYSGEESTLETIDNSEVAAEAHGAGSATSKKLFDMKPDVLITGNGPGETASKVMKQMRIRIFTDAQGMSLRQAYEAFQHGKLKELQL